MEALFWLAIGSFACQHFRFGGRFRTPTNAPFEAQELYHATILRWIVE
ncbi:BZ3500_MvSof-1268-A1-R1_Chr9g10552 [Microbotryum saponariae]|uniref:BZ3500_MvSof-1268-A1-R1_Chr9g10552 protein n=1 Tax=Microbotryum saponariae TaxID=289078 RepID=A0A2X0N4X8_9BASI|nr:BZ3501_MvSof-1269-A2-R1_Chr9g10301 [Microbotryum saponariae]SDA00286.1 BZ3500_MvSof-1268-A1-R1_Chr9g10552 [Microbotryum saponariae]